MLLSLGYEEDVPYTGPFVGAELRDEIIFITPGGAHHKRRSYGTITGRAYDRKNTRIMFVILAAPSSPDQQRSQDHVLTVIPETLLVVPAFHQGQNLQVAGKNGILHLGIDSAPKITLDMDGQPAYRCHLRVSADHEDGLDVEEIEDLVSYEIVQDIRPLVQFNRPGN